MNMRYKYPRTPHLPWSPGASADDVHLDQTVNFEGRDVVVTEKMDGENTSMYSDHVHARSIDSAAHPSRERIKALRAEIGHLIPEGWRLCGENVYARHSIAYENLEGYFYLFSIWDENNICLSWDDTLEWAALLNLPLPTIFYRGPWDAELIQGLSRDMDTETVEGLVVRTVDGFPHEDFGKFTAKWVRTNHVRTDKHWMQQELVPNSLSTEDE